MTGLGVLLRHYLRRDVWILLAWTVGITLLYWTQAVGVKGLYATRAEFEAAAELMEKNAAFIAMAGPARALDTIGGQVTWQSTAFGAVTIGLMVMLLLGRHTRAEEEKGRDELLRAAPVAGTAPMLAAVVECLLASLLVGVAVAVSLVTFPLAAADSWALGLGLAAFGWLFSGVALVAMQLTTSPRSAYGLVGAALGAAYLLRAVGDLSGSWLVWLSPIGWYQAMHAFSGLRWWPGLLLVAAAVPALALGLVLFHRRDHGSGLWAARPGPATAGRGLGTPLGLAWRLQRGSVLAWTLGLIFTGLAYGSIGDSAGDLLGDSDLVRDMMAAAAEDVVDGFFAVSLVMLALLAAAFAVASALRPRAEEEDGRLEPVVATGTSRAGWLLGNLAVTVAGTVLMTVAGGAAMGLGYGAVTGDWGRVVPWTLAMLAWTAPVLLLVAVTVLLFGLRARLARLAWVALLFCVVVLLFAETFRWPGWLRNVSPFEHLALVPVEDFRVLPVVVVTGLAAAVGALGLAAFSRRDLR